MNMVTGNYTIRLLNLSGQAVFKRQISFIGANDQTILLDHDFPAGNYLLQITCTSGKQLITKIIVE